MPDTIHRSNPLDFPLSADQVKGLSDEIDKIYRLLKNLQSQISTIPTTVVATVVSMNPISGLRGEEGDEGRQGPPGPMGPSPGGMVLVVGEVPTGAVDGLNTVFTTANIYQVGTLQVHRNGVRQKAGADYTETTNTTFTFVTAPLAGDLILIDYQAVSGGSGNVLVLGSLIAGPMGPPGLPGDDGEPSFIPGPQGPQGAAGVANMSGGAITTREATSSTTYTDLTTVGPSTTVTTGTQVVIWLSAVADKSTVGNTAFISVAVSGATTLAASDANSASESSAIATGGVSIARVLLLTGLTAGSNTFTMKYRVDGGTWNFANRSMVVSY